MQRRFRNPSWVVRLFSLTGLVALFSILGPSIAEAQLHGAAIAKGCLPKQTCGSNADCQDANSCDGLGICTSTQGGNVTECSIQVTNTDQFNDNIRVLTSRDRVKPGALDEVIVTPLVISAISGATTCTVGGTLPCDLGPAATVTFLSNQYVIQPTDPNPLPDQGEAQFQDLCNGITSPSCSATVNLLQSAAQTALTSGCQPGPTCTPTASPTPTNTPTTPTLTPIPGGPPPAVPTLSFPMMALLGLILAGAGLFLARRQ